ncbi:MAG TPA: Gfo/Idh/MocA family oxidoreductase [Armatimonadota bacterium]|nr:Gfo/Idh/MocA family oxidoreductase [Armatimonadota bacterium]
MATKVGFIGCGGMNRSHMNRVKAMRGAEIVALCDVAKDRAETAAEEFGGAAFTDHTAMISDVDMDACFIAMPPFAHTDQEILCAEKGIHLFVEKPVAVDLKTAKKIQKAIEKAGIIATAGFQDRYQDIVKKLQGMLKKTPPGLVMGYWIGGMPGVPWWRRKEQSGGQAMEQTIHTFDMARYLLGDVKTVHATFSKGLMKDVPKYNVEDASCVNLQFKSGLCGTIFSGCFLKGYGKVGLDIWCPEVKYEYAGRSTLTVSAVGQEAETLGVGNDFGTDIVRTFINAVKKGDGSKLKSTYADAVSSLAVVDAANESMKTKQAVRVKA